MDSLFSLDVTGESFPEPPVESDPREEEETSINVKDASDSKVNVLEEETKLVKISLASHIRDINRIDMRKNPDQYELYRNITMDIRKFIYNSIVSEDFCVSCTVVKDSDPDASKINNTHDGWNDRKSKVSRELVLDDDNYPALGSSPLNTPKNLSSSKNSYSFDENIISPKTSMSLDTANDVASFPMDDSLESLTHSESESLSSDDSLESISLENSDIQNSNNNSQNNENFKDSDCIMLHLSPTKLNRTIMEMAHVQMRRFFASYPRNFKIITGNIGSDVYAVGRRYYVSSDQTSSELTVQDLEKNHIFYLSHLYRRQRTICYYCGFLKCARSTSSKNSCEYQKCTKCVGSHKWSYNSCKGNGKMLEQYLRTSDWRIRRPNIWLAQNKAIRRMLRCFYCNNEGEANFKCQGLSCPEGLETLWIRCLELLGKNILKQERQKNPHLFPHLSKKDFVFTKNFKVNFKR